MTFTAADHGYMARALRLAERGLYSTSPNPRVGCVLVRDNCIIAEGWHERAGEPHAEAHALRRAAEQGVPVQGATAYVTLEPCSHFGRTPPCAEALVAAGVSRVVAAMEDPNPLVAGKGLARLAAAGIGVACGLMQTEARELNIGFVSRMARGRPWVRMKAAASLDGKTALASGESQWITGPDARQDGHRWRARACAVLTGIGTVLDDDPRLSVRGVETGRQPLKVVVDSRFRLSPSARLFEDGQVLVVGAVEDRARIDALVGRGAEVLLLPNGRGQVDLDGLLAELGRRGINEVHVEAGQQLNGALLREGVVDEFLLYLAPCLLGHSARGIFGLPEMDSLAAKPLLAIRDLRQVGADIRILARPN